MAPLVFLGVVLIRNGALPRKTLSHYSPSPAYEQKAMKGGHDVPQLFQYTSPLWKGFSGEQGISKWGGSPPLGFHALALPGVGALHTSFTNIITTTTIIFKTRAH